MPGSTDNTNLLAAANQLIKAVNDLAATLETGGTAAIADAITAQTTVIETRSIADTTAMNTNFSNLIDAVDGVNVSLDTTALANAIQACCTNVNSNLGLMIGAIRAIKLVTTGGGGYGGGISGDPYVDPPPIVPDNPGGDLPLDEKCQAANYVFWTITSSLRSLAVYQNLIYSLIGGEQNVANIITGILTSLGVLAHLSTGGMSSIVVGVTGLILSAGNWLIVAYFDYLATSLEEDKQDIICNLYNTKDANEARDYIHSIIDTRIDAVAALPIEGLAPLASYPYLVLKLTLREVAKTIAGNYLVNILFDPSSDTLATEVPDTLPCNACNCTIRWDFDNDTEGWNSVIDSNGNTVVQSWSTNQALRTEITMLNTGNGATGKWEYIPADHNQEFIVSTGDTLETILNFIVAGANGAHLSIYFTDATSIDNYIDVGSSPQEFAITIDAANTGKTIEKLSLDYHIGPGGNIGTATIGEWDYVQLTLAAGGC